MNVKMNQAVARMLHASTPEVAITATATKGTKGRDFLANLTW